MISRYERMFGIKYLVSYICLFQVICKYLGMLAMEVHITPNITALLGEKNTNLTCSFVREKGEQIFNVDVIAKNITDDVDAVKQIVSFNVDRGTRLLPSGKYLSDRVTLTNITNTSTYVTLTLHTLKCTDEKNYICNCYFYNLDGAIKTQTSAITRILVKVPVRDVRINKQPNRRRIDDRKTNSITLTCKARGDPEPEYKWFKEDNNNTIISITNFYVIEDVIRNNSGVYICEAHNSIGYVKYTQSNAVEIDIVDELLPFRKSASWKISAVHAAYAVPLILAVGFIVIFVAVRKYCFDSKKVETNKESRCLNPKKLDYTPVYDKNNTAQDVESEVNSNGINMIKENKSSFRNNEVKTVDTSQNKPSLIDIYDVPSDTVSDGIVKDRGKNEDYGVSDQGAVYSEVFNQANMKSEMSKARTPVLLDNVDHDGVCVEQCQV